MKKMYFAPLTMFFSLLLLVLSFFSPQFAYAMKEDVFIYLGTTDKSKCEKTSEMEGEYFCLSFHKKSDPQNKVYLWASNYIFKNFKPKKNIDLRVAYLLDKDTNFFLASMPNPPKAKVITQTVHFLGQDNDAPSSGYFMFKLPKGEEVTYRCLDDFCEDMLKHKNKKIEIQIANEHFYHEGAESYVEQTFVRSFKPL